MDLYYDTEKPLPKDDSGRLARLVLAVTEEEKTALATVLAEFFTLEDGAYHNHRCDREIARYQALRVSASKAGKASAAIRYNEKATPVERPLDSRSTNQNQNQNQSKPKPKAQRFAPPPWIPEESWKGFEAMRVKIRKPMTDRAKAMIVKQLENLKAEGHDPVAVLAQSEVHSWADVYPIKANGGKPPTGLPPGKIRCRNPACGKIISTHTDLLCETCYATKDQWKNQPAPIEARAAK